MRVYAMFASEAPLIVVVCAARLLSGPSAKNLAEPLWNRVVSMTWLLTINPH